MANATNAIKQNIRSEHLAISTKLTVAAGVTIYEGTLVSIDGSGNAIVAATNARIAGVAKETKTAGEELTVYHNHVHRFIYTSVAATAVNTAAYAADNQTAQANSNTAILGPVVDVGTNVAWIHLTLRA